MLLHSPRPGFSYLCHTPPLPPMSARLMLRLLTLLLGSFYLGSVCELDTEECKQNYAKECHAYVAARPEVTCRPRLPNPPPRPPCRPPRAGGRCGPPCSRPPPPSGPGPAPKARPRSCGATSGAPCCKSEIRKPLPDPAAALPRRRSPVSRFSAFSDAPRPNFPCEYFLSWPCS